MEVIGLVFPVKEEKPEKVKPEVKAEKPTTEKKPTKK